MRYKPSDKAVVVEQSLERTYGVPVGSVGTVNTVTSRGVLVDFNGVHVWCRYKEVKKYSKLDEYFAELDELMEEFKK